MPTAEETVAAYLAGEISRRTFVRRLTAAGVGLSAAVAYSQLLTPEWAHGESRGGIEAYCTYYPQNPICDPYGEPNPYPNPDQGQNQGQQQQQQQQQQPQANTAVLDTRAPIIRMRLSRFSLTTLLATGRFIVRFRSDEAALVTIDATIQVPGGSAARAVVVARGWSLFRRAGTKKIAVRLTRRGRRLLRRRRRVTLTVAARAVDPSGNRRGQRRRVRLRRRRRRR